VTRIFISYRQDDTDHFVGRLYDHLVEKFNESEVFRDRDDLKKGDFQQAIKDWIASCTVVIAVIGSRWLDIRDEKGKRKLDNPKDWVRYEISAALKNGITVVPVLVDGVNMPKSADLPAELANLPNQQYRRFRSSTKEFDEDFENLVEAIGGAYGTLEIIPTINSPIFSTRSSMGRMGPSFLDTPRRDFDEYEVKIDDEIQNFPLQRRAGLLQQHQTLIPLKMRIKEGTHRISLSGIQNTTFSGGVERGKLLGYDSKGKKLAYYSNVLSVRIKGGQTLKLSYAFDKQYSGTLLVNEELILKPFQQIITE